jgi:hypothetical protein
VKMKQIAKRKLTLLGSCVVCCFCTLMLSTLSHAQLPTGPWEVVANGTALQLNINSIDTQGNLIGTLVRSDGGIHQIYGFWSQSARKVTFVRTINNASVIQVFTGYLLNRGADFCVVGSPQFRYTLAGSFEAFASTGATRDRTVFGWVARQCGPIVG